MNIKNSLNKNLKKMHGAIAVELALVSIFIFLPLFFLATEMSRAMYQYNTLVKGVQDAASYLSKFPANDLTHDTAAQNLVIYGGPIGTRTGTKLVSTLATSNISITRTKSGKVNLVTVAITNFTYTYLMKNIANPSNLSFTFGNISATMAQVSS